MKQLAKVTQLDTVSITHHASSHHSAKHLLGAGVLAWRTRMPQESRTTIRFSFTGGKAALEDFCC